MFVVVFLHSNYFIPFQTLSLKHGALAAGERICYTIEINFALLSLSGKEIYC
jgi:hypothetical protein